MLEYKPKTPAQENALYYNILVNKAIGERLRQTRAGLGLTQVEVGAFWGITFQQVQKYENGSNRINAARLFIFLDSYNVSVAEFFESLDMDAMPTKNATTKDLKLYDKIRKIQDPDIKQAVTEFIYTLARAEQ